MNAQDILRQLFDAAIAAADPESCVPPHMPPDDGGSVMALDGSYLDEKGAALRLDTADENHIRLFYLGAGEEYAACFDLGRKKPCLGEVSSPMPGEGNLPYLGGFGMNGDAIRVRVLFPTAPFALDQLPCPVEADLLHVLQWRYQRHLAKGAVKR